MTQAASYNYGLCSDVGYDCLTGMTLRAGEKLGPYEILGPLGAGGMGVVYRARDARLGRDVAIKVASDRFSDRFEREARAVAALNHPNICHLYDIGPNYLVMELVEGQAPRGPLPVEEALRVAKQIANALSAAHEKGIVHRDLKPANIKVTADGTVKVLDFGLARVQSASGSAESSPTRTAHDTQAGAVIGTPAYMAPEQAAGKSVDKRADIWAFGVVLYELLTGEPAFKGDAVSEILAAVLKDRPDLERVPAQTRRLLRRCLERDPKDRLRDIADAWALLDEDETAGPSSTSATRRRWRPRRADPDRPLVRLEVDLGADVSLPPPGNGYVAISPDATRIAFVASVDGDPNRLYTRRLDQATTTLLPGTEGATFPFFSPDGHWIGFLVQSTVNKISVDGGSVVPIGDAGGIPAGASWAEDDSIVVGGVFFDGLRQIAAKGGAWTTLTKLCNEKAHAYPQVLAGGNVVLFVSFGQSPDIDQTSIDVVTLSDGVRKTLVRGGTAPRYVSSGHLIYSNRGALFAIPFDVARLETRGNAVRVLEDVRFRDADGAVDVTVSRDGTLVYRAGVRGTASVLTSVQWIEATGKRSPLTTTPGNYQHFRLSPDGKRLALTIKESGRWDIWVYDAQRMNRLTFEGKSFSPIWSPNGRYVVYTEGSTIRWTRGDRAGEAQSLLQGNGINSPSSFTRDGKKLAFVEFTSAAKIHVVSVEDEGGRLKAGVPEPFAQSPIGATAPAFSPDGRWLAYTLAESGRDNVFVQRSLTAPSGQSGRTLVSRNQGANPRWSRNGRELLYVAGDRLMSVSYTVKDDAFVADAPRVRVERLGGSEWDLAPDGRIAVLTSETAGATTPDHTVVFLQNFFDELRRRAPVN